MSEVIFTNSQMKLMDVMASNAAMSASRALSKWMRSGVEISHESVSILPFEELASKLGDGESVSVALYLNVATGMAGSLLLVFSEKAAFEFIDAMIKKEKGTTQELNDLGRSVLLETANIVGSAYLNSFRNNTQTTMLPSPPILIHDLSQSIMDSVLMEQAEFQDQSLFIDAEFHHDQSKIECNFFFLPVYNNLKELLSSLNSNGV